MRRGEKPARSAQRSAPPLGPGPHAVERLGHDGDGCIAAAHGAVFVRGALPGDTVEIAGVRREGPIWRAELSRVVVPSPDRVAPACPLAAACGGCPLMAASDALEAREKRGAVERALGAAGLAAPTGVELVAVGPTLGYRVRARLAFRGASPRGRIGYRAAERRTIVDVERCIVLDDRLGTALGALRDALGGVARGEGELHLGLGATGPVVRMVAAEAQPPALYAALARLVETHALGGAELVAGGATVPARWGEPAEVAHDVDGRALRLSPGGFRQAHEAANAELARTVLAWAGLEAPGAPRADDAGAAAGRAAPRAEALRVLELFAGHGNFTLPLAARAGTVLAVEHDAEAAAALEANLARHALSAEVVAADAAGVLERRKKALRGVDVVVLDPPRAGARECTDGIAALAPGVIVYVSCEPRTLARDAAALVAAGYVLERVRAVQSFPRTAHVEAVARLVRGHG